MASLRGWLRPGTRSNRTRRQPGFRGSRERAPRGGATCTGRQKVLRQHRVSRGSRRSWSRPARARARSQRRIVADRSRSKRKRGGQRWEGDELLSASAHRSGVARLESRTLEARRAAGGERAARQVARRADRVVVRVGRGRRPIGELRRRRRGGVAVGDTAARPSSSKGAGGFVHRGLGTWCHLPF